MSGLVLLILTFLIFTFHLGRLRKDSSIDDVQRWLEDVKLSHLKPLFRKWMISGLYLVEMREQDIVFVGVTDVEDIQALLHVIQELKSG